MDNKVESEEKLWKCIFEYKTTSTEKTFILLRNFEA